MRLRYDGKAGKFTRGAVTWKPGEVHDYAGNDVAWMLRHGFSIVADPQPEREPEPAPGAASHPLMGAEAPQYHPPSWPSRRGRR